MPLLPSLLLAAAVATLAWRAAALRTGGAVVAAAIGTLILWRAGWPGGLVLLAFFLPTSAVSRLWPARPSALDPKDDRRDALQVLANGGPATLALLLGGPGAWPGYAAGLAAAAADSWATTFGAQSSHEPRLINSGRRVPRGTSGGVTVLGTLSAGLGAAIVAAAAAPHLGASGAMIVAGIGLSGMFLDSLLGASVQGRFRCDGCGVDSEWKAHRCGRPTRHLGGAAWLTNDGVNALSTAAAALAGWACG